MLCLAGDLSLEVEVLLGPLVILLILTLEEYFEVGKLTLPLRHILQLLNMHRTALPHILHLLKLLNKRVGVPVFCQHPPEFLPPLHEVILEGAVVVP